MRFAIVEDNLVTNIIEAEERFGLSIGAIPIAEIGVGIGDSFIDGKFTVRVAGGFVEKPPIIIEEPVILTLEERISIQGAENTKLKAELEVTQAVVDELLFGGAL